VNDNKTAVHSLPRTSAMVWLSLNPRHINVDGSAISVIRPPFTMCNIPLRATTFNLAPPDKTPAAHGPNRARSGPIDNNFTSRGL
jgi:hypothetical protein